MSSDEVEFVEDRDTIRQQVVAILTATLREEEKADAEVRKKITSQKKEISKAAKSGTCSIANITSMSCGGLELRQRRKNGALSTDSRIGNFQ